VSFRAVIERWHDTYIVAGTAAATLVGLLFVSLRNSWDLLVSVGEATLDHAN
jgi:hypothetical protein